MQIAFEYAKIMCSRRVEYVVQPQLFWGKTFDNWSFSVIEKQGKTEQNKKILVWLMNRYCLENNEKI